jgi:hypothetical protein
VKNQIANQPTVRLGYQKIAERLFRTQLMNGEKANTPQTTHLIQLREIVGSMGTRGNISDMKKFTLILGLLSTVLSCGAFAWENTTPSKEDLYFLSHGYVNKEFKYVNKKAVDELYREVNNQMAAMYPMQLNSEVFYEGITLTGNMIIYRLQDLTINDKDEYPSSILKAIYDKQLKNSACAVWNQHLHKQNNRQLASMSVKAGDGSIIYMGSVENSECT